jgi:hypothetical protein
MEYDDYQDIILKAGKFTATYQKYQCNGWYQMSRATLAPFLKERNEVLHATNRCHHLPAVIQTTLGANLK